MLCYIIAFFLPNFFSFDFFFCCLCDEKLLVFYVFISFGGSLWQQMWLCRAFIMFCIRLSTPAMNIWMYWTEEEKTSTNSKSKKINKKEFYFALLDVNDGQNIICTIINYFAEIDYSIGQLLAKLKILFSVDMSSTFSNGSINLLIIFHYILKSLDYLKRK